MKLEDFKYHSSMQERRWAVIQVDRKLYDLLVTK
jgi:hypothetical protein